VRRQGGGGSDRGVVGGERERVRQGGRRCGRVLRAHGDR
jgi:hypothetical protein